MQLVYIALVTPVGLFLRFASGIIHRNTTCYGCHPCTGLAATSGNAADLAKSMGTLVGTVGTVIFYGTATMNLVWQHIGWRAVEKGEFKKLYAVDWGYPWISHLFFSFIPTVLMTHFA